MIGFHPTIETLGDEPFVPGSPGGEMQCPRCTMFSADAFKRWHPLTDSGIGSSLEQPGRPITVDGEEHRLPNSTIQIDWMQCANCQQIVIRLHETMRLPGYLAPEDHTNTWFVYPRTGGRVFPVGVPEEFRRDYSEAASLLDISPRMSGVLSRKILGDLLERYAGISNNSLARQIDTFAADPSHPRRLREGLHHFREVGDFAAHTQTDKETREIIDVGRDEAEWTLDRVDDLFEYFILDPQREDEMRAAMDAKIAAAGRKPIPPLPPDPPPPEVPSA